MYNPTRLVHEPTPLYTHI